jgi:hypothetical protein
LKDEIFKEVDPWLSIKERKFLIEMSYLLFIQYAMGESNYINLTCKDGIDRAGSMHALVYQVALIGKVLQGLDNKDFFEYIQFLPDAIYVDALAVKGRMVIRERLKESTRSSRQLLKYILNGNLSKDKFHEIFNISNLRITFKEEAK